MSIIAIIPARGGSKGVPRKNVRPLCGKPLIAWTIETAQRASSIERVVVSTEDPEIARRSEDFGAEVVWRPAELSSDTASSEDALLHTLKRLGIVRGTMAFLQCTSPLTLPEDVDGTIGLLESADSAFTGTPWHHFLWKQTVGGAQPIGHDKSFRPMRQQKDIEYLEVGAVYAMRIQDFIKTQSRFIGVSAIYPIPQERSLEIDTELDFMLAEALMRDRLQRDKAGRLSGGKKSSGYRTG